MNEVIGPVAESYIECQCAPSTVENSDLYPKYQDDSISNFDLDSIKDDHRHIHRSTAV